MMCVLQMATMFNYHKASPWFNEKYNPAEPYVNLRLRVRRDGWLGRISNFIHQLDEGQHDPILGQPEKSMPEASPSSPNGDTEIPSTEEVKVDETAEGEDETPSGDNTAPSNGHSNGKKTGGPEPDSLRIKLRDDEVSVLPEGNQVLIRTIPPDIGRVKLERVSATCEWFVVSRLTCLSLDLSHCSRLRSSCIG